MFNKILIANRGEIACRVIKTARRLGIKTVAVFSDADVNALHVSMADEAFNLGPAPSKDSYLKGDKIIDIALSSGAEAIHPGYGFLSENADFANACSNADITFIGPPASAIQAMGSKSAAKRIMQAADVPLVPGYHGEDQNPDTLRKHARDMGYPVLLKAAAGGGGKGMRQVHKDEEFDTALDAAKREAMSSFSDDIMLVEKYLTRPRHVEIQVFCDSHGNGVYLFERDCSVQRRHQKVIEEAPAPGMTEELRKKMGQAALDAAHAIDYVGAGTVEFLLDEDGSFYFMEMNTRLQVEHPVTEMITAEDLVEWQILVAAGHPLPKPQESLQLHGHAFEARIYAEDPNNEFLPETGRLDFLSPPTESNKVRVDTGVIQGDEVSVYYDPMIAKLIVWDNDRASALKLLQQNLKKYQIDGVKTNIDFLYNLASHPSFVDAELTTTFIERHEGDLFQSETLKDEWIPVIALAVLLKTQISAKGSNADISSPWDSTNHWRANSEHTQQITVNFAEQQLDIDVTSTGDETGNTWRVCHNNRTWRVAGNLNGHQLQAYIDGHHQSVTVSEMQGNYRLFLTDVALDFTVQQPDLGDDTQDGELNSYVAPMNGTVVAQLVEIGQEVKKGEPVIVVEAMKMEQTIFAHAQGSVSEFFYAAGDLVEGGATLLAYAESD